MSKAKKFVPISLPGYLRRLLYCTIAIGLMLILLAYTTMEREPKYIPFPCYMDPDASNLSPEFTRLEDVLRADIKPKPGRSIFFHETKCNAPNKHHIFNLTTRQACAIESAALHNPNFQVFVLFASPTFIPQVVNEKYPLIKALQSYSNIQLRQLNIWRYARNTPIEDWVNSGILFNSSFLTEHTSDLLRLMSLYHFGGVYMDIDVVVLRSLENLPLNYVGAQGVDDLCNAVISLAATGRGHEIAELFLRDYQQNYNGRLYVNNGPSLIGRVATKLCGNKSIRDIIDRDCNGFKVFNMSTFFPIPWPSWRIFFDPKQLESTMDKIKNSYLVHIWNKVSYEAHAELGKKSAYEKLAQQNCPKVYATVANYL